MSEPFEDRYLDVLQNIEAALLGAYREQHDMVDSDALDAVGALIRVYQAESRRRATPAIRLNTNATKAFDLVKEMCDWRLGRAKLGPLPDPAPYKTVDEIVACLKRVQRSIETWNREGGRRGYFNFISDFFPE